MYIDVNGITLHYKVVGEGKPLILLNPNSESTLIMLPIAKILSKYFKVYMVDRRGCRKI
ncbi:MAG: alpha/beta hydrolase [Clostridia bacterium]|nr:alpha/beta hydrolase [Clostridia bacterium]